MMTFLRNLFILLLLAGSGGIVSAQSVTHRPAIDIQRTGYDSTNVYLSWNTPPKAVSCMIVYETPSDTTFHTITGFQSGQTSLLRPTPLEFSSKFTIYFSDPLGNQAYDDGPGEIYGNIIVIEDDVFAMVAHDVCETGTDELEVWFKLDRETPTMNGEDSCVLSMITRTCNEIGLMTKGVPIADVNWEAVTFELRDSLFHWSDTSDQIFHCYEFPNARLGKYGDFVAQPAFTLHPNPASQFFMIQPQDGFDPENTEVHVIDPLGREVYSSNHPFAAGDEGLKINMHDWKPGLYIVLLGEGKQRQAIRLIKQ